VISGQDSGNDAGSSLFQTFEFFRRCFGHHHLADVLVADFPVAAEQFDQIGVAFRVSGLQLP
jgi:hypothetical protein